MFEIILPSVGILAILMFVAYRYYWKGFDMGAVALLDLLASQDKEAAIKLQRKLIKKLNGENND